MAGLKLATADGAAPGGQLVDGVRMPTAIVLRLVAELLPYAKNSRKHSPAQIDALARSMQGPAGFTNPLLIADDGILAGHGRLLAAHKIGLRRVPTINLSHLDADQRRALVIWDNRSAEIGGGYDLEMLKAETDYLRSAGYDLEAELGFSEEDLAATLADLDAPVEPGPAANPDDAPALPAHPVSALGDVWEIGAHRVMCGSSLEGADLDVLMAGQLADVVWTDPPYNVDIGDKTRNLDKALNRVNVGRQGKNASILNDKMDDKTFYTFLHTMFCAVREQAKPGAAIYVFHADSEGINFRTAFRDAGFKLQSVLSWRKNMFALSLWDHQPISEPCLYGWKTGAGHKWYGGRKQTTFSEIGTDSPFQKMEDGRWRVVVGDEVFTVSGEATVESTMANIISEPKPSRSDLHPTMKPTGLITRQLRNSARPGQLVLDAFGGSGSTAVAAHLEGMRSCLMELDPRYVDVIVTRMQTMTGLRAVHASTGELFPMEGEERAPEAAAVPHVKQSPAEAGDPF